MWNVISNPPYAEGNGIIARGFGKQTIAESQFVGLLYALISIAFVGLAVRVPTIKHEGTQQIAAYVGVAVFIVGMSVLERVFKIKNGGYPYKVFFLSYCSLAPFTRYSCYFSPCRRKRETRVYIYFR